MKVQTLVDRYSKEIKGVIECFDRVVLFGTYKALLTLGIMIAIAVVIAKRNSRNITG